MRRRAPTLRGDRAVDVGAVPRGDICERWPVKIDHRRLSPLAARSSDGDEVARRPGHGGQWMRSVHFGRGELPREPCSLSVRGT